MTTITLAASPSADAAEPLFEPRPFPTCAPWCSGEHWDGDSADEPGVCFASDVEVPFGAGKVSAAMSFDPNHARRERAEVSVTVFLASRDILDGLSVTDLAEGEVAAYVLLAMIAVSRGDQAAADRHQLAALDAAAKAGAR